MAFQNLRNNNLVYILHKDSKPYLEVGKVVSVSLPAPKFGGTNMYGEMIIDILVDINGMTTNFQKLPANANVADFGNNVVVACDRDSINNEVMSMKQKSQDVLDSIEIHQGILIECDKIINQLNPEIAEKLRQEKETLALKDELSQLKDMVKELLTTLK